VASDSDEKSRCSPRTRVRFWFKVNDAQNCGIKFRNRYFFMKSVTYALREIVNGNQRCYALSKCCYFPGVIDSQQRPLLIILLCEMDAASRDVA